MHLNGQGVDQDSSTCLHMLKQASELHPKGEYFTRIGDLYYSLGDKVKAYANYEKGFEYGDPVACNSMGLM